MEQKTRVVIGTLGLIILGAVGMFSIYYYEKNYSKSSVQVTEQVNQFSADEVKNSEDSSVGVQAAPVLVFDEGEVIKISKTEIVIGGGDIQNTLIISDRVAGNEDVKPGKKVRVGIDAQNSQVSSIEVLK